MAGSPPGPAPGGLPPPGPPPGPPGGMPPPQAPPGPPMAPPGGPPPPPGLTDLSIELTPAWQLVDVAARYIRAALNTEEFQNSDMAMVHALLAAWNSRVKTLIASHTTGEANPPSSYRTAGEHDDDEGSLTSPDADAQPSASEPEP